MKRIPLSQGQFALVDDEDFKRVNQFKWSAVYDRYVKGYRSCSHSRSIDGKRKWLDMARYILNAPKGKVVDHINHNTLDNRKLNLRICTITQNNRNRKPCCLGASKYKGIHMEKGSKKWRVRINVGGKLKQIGMFTDEIKAAIAYDEAAKKYFGEFAYLNFAQSG